MLWALPGIGDLQALGPHAFHIAAGFVLAVLLIVSGLLFGPDAAPGEIDLVSSGALAAYLFASMLLVLATGHDTLALTLFVALVAATIAIAWRTDAATAAVPAAAILVTLIFLHWSLDFDVSELGLPGGPGPRQPVEARALSVRRAAHARRLLRAAVRRCRDFSRKRAQPIR